MREKKQIRQDDSPGPGFYPNPVDNNVRVHQFRREDTTKRHELDKIGPGSYTLRASTPSASAFSKTKRFKSDRQGLY